ncbi:MAG TPA: hypothetical protein VKP88_02125 [Candidatus Paceibacterota bacterium]|nr:hypothetical protein [Candidatus Paceibacterota bacterium]
MCQWQALHVWVALDELDGTVSLVRIGLTSNYSEAHEELTLTEVRFNYGQILATTIEEIVANGVEWSSGAEEPS